MRIILLSGFVAVLVALSSLDVIACSCAASASPISQYKATPIVFIAVVTSIKEEKVQIDRFGEKVEVRTGLVAYLNIEEGFKGFSEKQVTVITGGGGGDCGFPFQVGRKYLVGAYPLNANSQGNVVSATVFGNSSPSKPNLIGTPLSTNICTLSNELGAVSNELEIIRDFVAGNPKPRIYGSVQEFVNEFNGQGSPTFVGPMINVPVVVNGQNGKFEIKTDDKGRFSFKGIAIGKYSIEFLLPASHTNLWSWDRLTYPIEIRSNEDTVEISFDSQPSAMISGTLRDFRGRPLSDDVQLSLIPAEWADKPQPDEHSRSEYTNKRGEFVFDGVKPGRYVLGISIAESPSRNTPFGKTYFPATSEFSKAQIIEIKVGQKLDKFDFTLPKELEKTEVEGVVLSAEGKPVLGADINLYDTETPNDMVFGFSDDVKTDANGRFKITGFKGRSYLLHAYKDTDYFAGFGTQSKRTTVVFDGSIKKVRLVLDQDGIFFRQLK